MDAAQRVGEARKGVALEPRAILPFGELGQAFEREVDRLAQLVRMQALGERIDGIDQRQVGETRFVHHAIGVHHLQVAVVERGGARHVALLPDGEELEQIIRARIEVGDDEIVRLVAHIDEVRRARPVRRRRPVAVDSDRDGDQGVGLDGGELRLVAPVDVSRRHVKQQIDEARRLAAASDQPAEQLFQLRPDAGQR